VPHWAAVSEAKGTQVVPLQQPLGHEVALQVPPEPVDDFVALILAERVLADG